MDAAVRCEQALMWSQWEVGMDGEGGSLEMKEVGGSRNDARGKVPTMCGVAWGYISKQCSCLEVCGRRRRIKPLQAHQIISVPTPWINISKICCHMLLGFLQLKWSPSRCCLNPHLLSRPESQGSRGMAPGIGDVFSGKVSKSLTLLSHLPRA